MRFVFFRAFLLSSPPELDRPLKTDGRVIDNCEIKLEVDDVLYDGHFNKLIAELKLQLCPNRRDEINVYRRDNEDYMIRIKSDKDVKSLIEDTCKPGETKKINVYLAIKNTPIPMGQQQDIICIDDINDDSKIKIEPLEADKEPKKLLSVHFENKNEQKRKRSDDSPKRSNATCLSLSVSSLNKQTSQIIHPNNSLMPINSPSNSKLPTYRLKSKILPSDNDRKRLLDLCQFNTPQTRNWNLIYRGTRDGFKAKDFHKKCDGKVRTLTIINSVSETSKSASKSPIKCVFGGYAESIHWSMSEAQERTINGDPNAFIFSLVNAEKRPMRIGIRKDNFSCSITGDPKFGPVFGRFDIAPKNGHDIFIADKANENYNSYSDLGSSYLHPDKESHFTGSIKAKKFLAGTNFFKVVEIETFQSE